MVDWWQKRETERALANELNVARERFRLANLRLRELTGAMPSGIPAPDSNLPIQQVRSARVQAYDEWLAALDRWTSFVKRGTIPEDLQPSTAEPAK